MTQIKDWPELTTLDYNYYVPIQLADGTTRKISLYTLLGVTPPVIIELLNIDFEGANNSTTFTDSSPSARTVTPSGNAKLSTTSPISGTSSGVFDGIGDYLTIPASNDFDLVLLGGITYSFRIKTTQSAPTKALLSRYSGSGALQAGEWVIYNHNGSIEVWLGDLSASNYSLKSTGVNCSDGAAHEIVFWRSGYDFKLSVDGTIVDSLVSGFFPTSTTAPLVVARDLTSGANDYQGSFDSLKVTTP